MSKRRSRPRRLPSRPGAALSAAERKPVLDRFAQEIGKRADAFCLLESNDAGVLLSRMRHGVVPRAMLNISWFAQHALGLQDRPDRHRAGHHIVRHDPAGVVVIITPWNAPLMLSTWKLGPALAAGNCCILKPPEWAPLTCSLLADAAHAAGLPPGVFNVVQGSGANTGAKLVSDPRIARVSFTGSVPTAKWIAQAAGANLVPCSLELGGKSPFIVLADADLDNAAATGALMYRNAGQVCLAGTRFLVHEKIADEFIAAMRGYVEKLTVGDPRDEATEVGPVIHPRQVERVLGFIERAVASGAELLWGGAKHAFGAQYLQPTMLTNLKQDDEIVQNEVFGPVLTLQTFASDDEADRAGQRHRLRPGWRVLRRDRARHRGGATRAHRLHLGQQLRHPRPGRALRRHQAQRHRPRGRQLELRVLLRHQGRGRAEEALPCQFQSSLKRNHP